MIWRRLSTVKSSAPINKRRTKANGQKGERCYESVHAPTLTGIDRRASVWYNSKKHRRPDMVEMRVCCDCNENKPIKSFPGTKVWKSPRCRKCERLRIKSQKPEIWEKRKRNSYRRRRNDRIKMKRYILTVYGGRCECCGEEEIGFLTIDHIDGKGAEHRREIGIKGG